MAGPDEFGRDDCWVAIAVATDEQWAWLRHALGDPEWAADPALATRAGHVREHDRIDAHLEEWCGQRSGDEVVALLWDAGVPVANVMQPHRQTELAQLEYRQFFEEVSHPVIGPSRYSTLPMRFSRGPDALHERPAPLLGEHTDELLSALGVTPSEMDELRTDGIIGGTPVRAT